MNAQKILSENNSRMTRNEEHCVKSIRIRSFSGPNTGKYGPEKLRIWTISAQWKI